MDGFDVVSRSAFAMFLRFVSPRRSGFRRGGTSRGSDFPTMPETSGSSFVRSGEGARRSLPRLHRRTPAPRQAACVATWAGVLIKTSIGARRRNLDSSPPSSPGRLTCRSLKLTQVLGSAMPGITMVPKAGFDRLGSGGHALPLADSVAGYPRDRISSGSGDALPASSPA